jgi:hypothetical protein
MLITHDTLHRDALGKGITRREQEAEQQETIYAGDTFHQFKKRKLLDKRMFHQKLLLSSQQISENRSSYIPKTNQLLHVWNNSAN